MENYTITPAIFRNISAIERLYGQLEALHLPKKLLLNLERSNLVQSSYVSNSIEGNPLSYPEVTNLLLGDRVPVNRSEKEVRNYFDLLKSLEARARSPFTLDQILAVHRDLMSGVDDRIAGQIRDERVVIGTRKQVGNKIQILVKHDPPYHDRDSITKALEESVASFNDGNDVLPMIRIANFHHRYVFIHPFADGNGRTVRLLTALLLIRAGYAVNRYFVLDDYYDVDRLAYSDALHTADQGDTTKWVEYFTEGIQYSLQSAIAKARNALKTMQIDQRPSKREQDVLALFAMNGEWTSGEVALSLGVSRQQAHRHLSALVEKGLLQKIGGTKKSYYRIER